MLFLFTVLLAVATSAYIWFFTGRWLTLATLYWAGWIVGSAGYQAAVLIGVLPEIDAYGERLILTTHYGASLGFLIASPAALWINRQLPEGGRPRVNGSGWVLVGMQFLLGLYLLVSRVATTGLNLNAIREDFLSDAYLTSTLPPEYRIYNYLSLLVLVPVVFIAARDREKGRISWRSLGLLLLAAAPGGLSTGGRIWLAQAVATYAVSYLFAAGPALRWQQSIRPAIQTTVAVIALAGVFTIFGGARDSATGFYNSSPNLNLPEWQVRQLETYAPLISYLGVSPAAVGSYGRFNEAGFAGVRLGGLVTFPFFAGQIARFGGADLSRATEYALRQRQWVAKNVDPRIGFTKASLAPLVIADFGEDALLPVTMAIFTVLMTLFLISDRLGGTWHVMTTMLALWGGLFLFQDAAFASASSLIPIIGAPFLAYMFRKEFVWAGRVLTTAD